jgi:nucleoside phosphorylase
VPLRTGTLDGRPVVATVTGMGTDLATRGAERLLSAVTPRRVVVVGITGAMEDHTPIGTLIRPAVVIEAATGEAHTPERLGEGPHVGTMWTTNVITPPSEVPALRDQGVVSLDMETAAIAACCERRGIPWSVFRCVSDRASDGSVDDELFKLSNQDGTPNRGNIARYLLRHPDRIPRLAKMGQGAALAATTAAAAAIAAVRAAG